MADDETQFVQILFSNASMTTYPNNKPQHFRVHLPQPIDLQGIWCVGLKGIQYPNNWYNVRKEFNFTVKSTASHLELKEIKVETGQYSDMADLCEKIQQAISKKYNDEKAANRITSPPRVDPTFGFEFLRFEQRVRFSSDRADATIDFSPKEENRAILNILGIYPDSALSVNQKGKHDASLNMHFPALFIYTPIIQHTAVGDTRAPLLALVPITGRHKEYIFERYERPLFHRLAHNQISEIEILITDDTGTTVPFLAGKVTLILEFRRQA